MWAKHQRKPSSRKVIPSKNGQIGGGLARLTSQNSIYATSCSYFLIFFIDDSAYKSYKVEMTNFCDFR